MIKVPNNTIVSDKGVVYDIIYACMIQKVHIATITLYTEVLAST